MAQSKWIVKIMNVKNDLLNYRNMKIIQNTDMFKFSLDSVLLPNFVTINKKDKKILDIGCGNAPIPLILSTKTQAEIIGVEIQEEVADLALKSVSINNLDNQIKIINADINEISKKWKTEIFDVITCNPPFFKIAEKSNLNLSEYQARARHEVSLTLEQLVQISCKLLKNKGNLAIVHRPERLMELLFCLKKYNLEPKKIQFVYPNTSKESNIVLIEAKKNGNSGVKILEPIFVHEKDGSYTKQVLKFFEEGE